MRTSNQFIPVLFFYASLLIALYIEKIQYETTQMSETNKGKVNIQNEI